MQVYYAQKGVEPEVAFDIADEYYNKRHQKKISGVMFDQPFRNDFIVEEEYIAGQQVVEKTEDEKILDNPNLPSDVKSKTFRGSDDAKKDLDSMIGLASVKDQIEKLENRIKFYGNQNNGNHMQFLGSALQSQVSTFPVWLCFQSCLLSPLDRVNPATIYNQLLNIYNYRFNYSDIFIIINVN